MKKISVVISIAAIATASLTASATKSNLGFEVYGQDYMGFCVKADNTLEEECSPTSGIFQCHVYLESTAQVTVAWYWRLSATSCGIPLRRW